MIVGEDVRSHLSTHEGGFCLYSPRFQSAGAYLAANTYLFTDIYLSMFQFIHRLGTISLAVEIVAIQI